MKKRTYIWRIATVALLGLLLISQPLLAGQAPAEDNQKAQTVYTDWTEDSSVYVPVCTDGDITLSFKEDDMMFRLEKGAATPDPASEDEDEDEPEAEEPTGAVWYSGMTSETFSELQDSSRTWRAYMTSLLAVTYAARTETRGNTQTAYSASSDANVTAKVSENGLQFAIEFPEEGIAVTLEVALENGNLVARIPADSIREDGDYVVVKIEPLPFFGAVAKETTTDGYLVYPDGSGAITYFDRVDDKSAYALPIQLDIYDTMDLEKTLADKQEPTAMLPIYGIKKDNTAILAAITDGEENAKIVASAALEISAVPIHRSSFELWYRNEYRIFLSAVSDASSAAVKQENFGVKFDTDLQVEDREITYFLLTDDEADYSGMANAYREYLIENGLLKKSEGAARELFLTLFMGAEKEDAMLDAYVPMTSFEQAQEICQTLIDSGFQDLDVLLRGWGKDGYGIYPQVNKTDKDLGGRKGMDAFNDFVGSQSDLTVSLETELLYTNKNNYISVKGTNVPITDKMEELFLLTPKRVSKQLAKMQKETNRYDNLLLALPTVGKRIYPDYDKEFVSNRFNTVQVWKEVASNEIFAASQGGNLYTLPAAKHLYDMPTGASMQQMTDESIPWYYMIVSGNVSYSTLPGNRTGDLQQLKLQWIEYGATPTFELTANKSLNLYGTTYNALFSSEFAQWKDRVIEVTSELKTALKDVSGESIVKHEILSDKQVCVTYANGYRIVINYADEAFDFEGNAVKAQNYLVLAPAN